MWKKVEILENKTDFQSDVSKSFGVGINRLSVLPAGYHRRAADRNRTAVSLFKLVYNSEQR